MTVREGRLAQTAATEALAWLRTRAAVPSETHRREALARQAALTKPPGALGELESLAVHLAALQGRARPAVERVRIVVFAADHGIAAEEGVSAFPPSVTVEMVRNFARGGAAVNVLARALGASLEVVDVGTRIDPGLPLPGCVLDRRIAPGTANFRRSPAMSASQLAAALAAGAEAVERARTDGTELFIGGEMGIGNTTSAAAVACALLGLPGVALAGPGTGLDAAGVARKAAIIDEALARHRPSPGDPLEALRCLGGFEIAALAGAFVRAAQLGLPVLVDGFIASVAALCALRWRGDAAPWFFYGHTSAEPGHRRVLAALGARPLLDLGMRLGEGSGAAAAVPLLRLACALHNEMATFAEAGVSEKSI
jgi:nicotinate-nucleotide--dimethylbenzimidazole phosphoribosyltransferase